MSSRARATDATDWANKRKASIERAKALREDRKSGKLDENNYSFAPQVNKRPTYLDSNKSTDQSKSSASLIQTDNIFEQPLPGRKTYQTPIDPLSPGSDALGTELKKFPGGASVASSQNQQKALLHGDHNKYRSNFMQQMNAPGVGNVSVPSRQSNELDQSFVNGLRANEGGGRRRNVAADWNNDTSAEGLLDSVQSMKPRMTESVLDSVESDKPRRRREQSSAAVAQSTVSEYAKSGYLGHSSSAYNGPKMSPRLGLPEDSSSPSIHPRPSAADPSLMLGKSRLSLLKSKIRKSESGNGIRGEVRRAAADIEYEVPTADRALSAFSGLSRGQLTSLPIAGTAASIGSSACGYDPSVEMMRADRRPRDREAPKPGAVAVGIGSEGAAVPILRGIKSAAVIEDASDTRGKMLSARRLEQNRNPNIAGSSYPQLRAHGSGGDIDEAAPSGEQIQCPDCGRKFNAAPYQKHIKICAKVFLQKRKVFDAQKMRVQDNPELVKILAQKEREEKKARLKVGAHGFGSLAQQQITAPAPDARFAVAAAVPGKALALDRPLNNGGGGKAKWKEDSSALRDALKAARAVAKAQATGAPLPPPVISAPDPSLVQCPHCQRRFNETAAARHIPQCKNIIAKPSVLKRGQGGGGGINGALAAKVVQRGVGRF